MESSRLPVQLIVLLAVFQNKELHIDGIELVISHAVTHLAARRLVCCRLVRRGFLKVTDLEMFPSPVRLPRNFRPLSRWPTATTGRDGP